MRRTIRSIPNNNYTKKHRLFGVIFGLILTGLSGYAIYNYPPTTILEILVVLAFSLGLYLIRGKFLVLLILGLPLLFRLGYLNILTVALWLLILGLLSLIN